MRKPSLVRRIVSEFRWRTKKFSSFRSWIKRQDTGSFKTNKRNLVRYGKPFITSFPTERIPGKKRTRFESSIVISAHESLVSVVLTVRSTGKNPAFPNPVKIAEAPLSFDRKNVLVEIQGSFAMRPELDRFKTITGKQWAHYLLDRIEQHAKDNGFRQIKLRLPESLPDYKEPVVVTSPKEAEQVRKNMRALYYNVAKKRGYNIKGDYFVGSL